jgi:hypothetical protein
MASRRWLSVGQASRVLGMSRTTLLAAEDAGLVAPVRTPGGHRRYELAELERYLGRATVPADPGGPVPTADLPGTPSAEALDLARLVPTLRDGTRAVARVLGAPVAGAYVRASAALRFAVGTGVPRWLAERLADRPAPPVIEEAAHHRGYHLFDAAVSGFPEARSTGRGVAVGLRDERADVLGVLFLLAGPGRELVPAEIHVVEAVAEVLAGSVAARREVVALEGRLARIAALATGSDSAAADREHGGHRPRWDDREQVERP